MIKVLLVLILSFLYPFCYSQQVDLCLSGSGEDRLFTEVKILPDSSRLYLIQTNSRDGIFQNDSANLYVVKVDKYDQLQFVHPVYYQMPDTFFNPYYLLGEFNIANDDEIFVAYIVQVTDYDESTGENHILYELNYEMMDDSGNKVYSASNVFTVSSYFSSTDIEYYVNTIKIIAEGKGNYSLTTFNTTISHGEMASQVFPFFKIRNYNFTPVNIFQFLNNSDFHAYRNVVALDSFFVYSFSSIEGVLANPRAFPQITVVNSDGDIVYDSIISNAPSDYTDYLSTSGNLLYFNLAENYVRDSMSNDIIDSAFYTIYKLDCSQGIILSSLLKKKAWYDPFAFRYLSNVMMPKRIKNQFHITDPIIGDYNLIPQFNYVLQKDLRPDSTFQYYLHYLLNDSLPVVYSFTDSSGRSIYNLTQDSNGFELFYKSAEDDIIHLVKFNAGRQFISEDTFTAPMTPYDDIYLDYLPLNKKLTVETWKWPEFITKLYVLDTFTNTFPVFTWNGGDLFNLFENGQKNIYAVIENNNKQNDPCSGGRDVMIYKIAKDSIPTGILQSRSPRILCFPNPASNMVEIDVRKLHAQTFFISLFDLNGKMISSQVYQNSGFLKFDVHSIPSGIYELVISSRNGIVGNAKISIFH